MKEKKELNRLVTAILEVHGPQTANQLFGRIQMNDPIVLRETGGINSFAHVLKQFGDIRAIDGRLRKTYTLK